MMLKNSRMPKIIKHTSITLKEDVISAKIGIGDKKMVSDDKYKGSKR